MVEELLKPSEVCRLLNISYVTLRKWVKEGEIRYVVSPSGRYLFPRSEVDRILKQREKVEQKEIRAVIYARVSSVKQRDQGDLDRQVEFLKRYAEERGYRIIDVITDVGSGLKENRRGLKKLLKFVTSRKVDVVLVTYRDRLTRFGFRYLEYFFNQFGVKIEEVMKEEKEPLEELIEDFVEIIVSFAGKIYGRRSKKIKQLVELNQRFLEQNLPRNK